MEILWLWIVSRRYTKRQWWLIKWKFFGEAKSFDFITRTVIPTMQTLTVTKSIYISPKIVCLWCVFDFVCVDSTKTHFAPRSFGISSAKAVSCTCCDTHHRIFAQLHVLAVHWTKWLNGGLFRSFKGKHCQLFIFFSGLFLCSRWWWWRKIPKSVARSRKDVTRESCSLWGVICAHFTHLLFENCARGCERLIPVTSVCWNVPGFWHVDIARAEALLIANTSRQYLTPKDGSPLRGLVQDHVCGGMLMTKR